MTIDVFALPMNEGTLLNGFLKLLLYNILDFGGMLYIINITSMVLGNKILDEVLRVNHSGYTYHH